MIKGNITDPCGVLEIALLGENPQKFIGYGALRAARSDASANLRNYLDNTFCEGKESLDENGNPLVRIQYMVESEGEVVDTFSCEPESGELNVKTIDWTLDKYLQGGISYAYRDMDAVCCQVDSYLDAISTNVSLGLPAVNNELLSKFQAVGNLKARILSNFKSKFLNPIEDYLISQLVVGYNPVKENADFNPIVMRDSSGNWTSNLVEEIAALKMKTGYCDQYIAIGGIKWATWFGDQCAIPNIFCCSALTSVDFGTMRETLPIEFYYSSRIDAAFGTGALILIERDKFALLTYSEADKLPQSICCEHYGSLSVSVGSCCESTMTLPFDTWAIMQGKCATDNKPSIDLFYGIKYGAYVQPFSFDTADPVLSAVTGLYGFKWQ